MLSLIRLVERVMRASVLALARIPGNLAAEVTD
jgi:hypothetical protein